MRLLALSILVLATSCASDGPLGPAASDFRDFQKVNKRRDLDPQTCVDNFDIHRDKIIRTEDSKEMGAKYLNEIDLGSRDECLRLCCETETCDVFVFEEKSPGSCYLFHCGPPEDFKCKFTRHTNFSSAVLAVNRHLAELEDQIKLTKHEQDLASLRKQYQDVVTTIKPTTPHSVQMQVHETAPPGPARRCSRYQFECHSSEECIAIYNACDGIPQCADGSDEAPELGCPATTTLTPPPAPSVNLPPRELLPRLPQMQSLPAYMHGAPETIPQKEMPQQHPPAFMSPISSQDGAAWPRRLEQMPQPQVPHLKQYSDTLGGSHIFSHKGGLQVTEADSIAGPQYEYKPLPYDPIPDNSWQHRSWQQPQADAGNMNDGSQMYHMDMDNQNSWKQQQNLQNLQMQSRLQNNQNLLPPQRMQSEKMGIQGMPNLFQDRDKMWAVPQISNVQENQPVYTQTKIMPPPEESFEKSKPPPIKEVPHISEKVIESDEPEEETTEESKEKIKVELPEVKQAEKHKEIKSSKKHSSANKTKKKHLKSESDVNKDDDNSESKGEIKGETMMIKQFEDDVHDGAAERPPGAILLLTLGVCMTSIMIVLLGCRLKMAKKRMRRMGKSSFAHDADYLVNGMYL